MRAMIGAVAAALLAAAAPAAPLPAGVLYDGPMERPGTARATYQRLMLDLAGVWTGCDPALMRRTLSSDVDFSYPGQRMRGIDAALANLTAFCAAADDRSVYFPKDAFYIDAANGRIAAEVQFRTTARGQRQVVNDVWIATIRNDRIAIIKEYLDGRVRGLQAEGVLNYDEGAAFLTPWPSKR